MKENFLRIQINEELQLRYENILYPNELVNLFEILKVIKILFVTTCINYYWIRREQRSCKIVNHTKMRFSYIIVHTILMRLCD